MGISSWTVCFLQLLLSDSCGCGGHWWSLTVSSYRIQSERPFSHVIRSHRFSDCVYWLYSQPLFKKQRTTWKCAEHRFPSARCTTSWCSSPLNRTAKQGSSGTRKGIVYTFEHCTHRSEAVAACSPPPRAHRWSTLHSSISLPRFGWSRLVCYGTLLSSPLSNPLRSRCRSCGPRTLLAQTGWNCFRHLCAASSTWSTG